MNQVEVVALSGFDHNGRRMRGDRFHVSELHAKALQDRGLVGLPDDVEQDGKAPATSTARPVTGRSTTRAPRGKSAGAADKQVAETALAGTAVATDSAVPAVPPADTAAPTATDGQQSAPTDAPAAPPADPALAGDGAAAASADKV